MPRHTALWANIRIHVICLCLTFSLTGTLAAPNLTYPLMDQQPPVARVGSPFVFDLFPSTFTSNPRGYDLTYSTSSLPAWLSWSSSALAFTGTPSAADQGQQVITLSARDATGTTSSTFTLIVTNYTVPGVHSSFNTQLADPPLGVFASVRRLPAGSGVAVPPNWSFSIGFLYETFRLSRTEPTNGDLFFSARQRGTTSLPSWLNLNNETMTFTGVAPASGTYTIVATGSDFWGYSGAQSSFVIEVGQGQSIELARNATMTDIVSMSRNNVNYTIDASKVLVGGNTTTASQLQFSLTDPDWSWLSVSGNRLSGVTPDRFGNGTMQSSFAVPVIISSTNASNTLSYTSFINFMAEPYLFNVFSLSDTTINPGSAFSFSLDPYLNNKTATVNATVQPSEAANWLTFHTNNLSLTGTPPANPNYNTVAVIFAATSGGLTANTALNVTLAGVTATGTTTGTVAVPSSTGGSSGGLATGGKIALAVVFGVLGLIALLLLLLFCCRRRRKQTREEVKDDNNIFIVGSPQADPFRKSNTLDLPRNLLGEIARFSRFHLGRPTDAPPPSPEDRATRMDGLRGIFGRGEQAQVREKEKEISPPRNSSGSFIGQGDVNSVRDPVDRPSQDASSFTQTFGSSTDSRASWESRDSFRWSSGENGDSNEGNHRVSTAASIPRPRQDFTPRYPRQNSPTQLAQLASQHTLGSPEMSDLHDSGDSLSGSNPSDSFGSSSNPGQSSRQFGESGGFRSIEEEEEADTDIEGPAVVTMAERQSFETRTPRRTASGSQPFRSSRQFHQSTRSLNEDGMFDDAEEARRSMALGEREVQGLGYPASTIFGSPDSNGTRGVSFMSDSNRDSYLPTQNRNNRNSTITAIPPRDPLVLSPPLSQVGFFVRDRQGPNQPLVMPLNMDNRAGSVNDGRVIAVSNQSWSMHPTINPPPRIALSAATWSSAPPSTYRAEVVDDPTSAGTATNANAKERALPSWLRFDARELEFWGVPALGNAGEITHIRIIETLRRDKRNSDPSRFGYVPPQEREVGRLTVEVVANLPSTTHAQ